MAIWKNEAEAREQIKAMVAEYYHDFKEKKTAYQEGDRITYAARVFDEKEMCALTDANVYLDIIGWGNENYIKQIEREIEFLGLRKNVNLLGAKDDVGERLCNYQVGLMCSRAEGFGRVTVEYMHAGLGVIASKAGANEEIIENNVTGLLYTKGSVQELANKMREYFENRNVLSRCAKKGREHAENNFTKSINAKNIYNIYVSLMAKK